jgi:uncharacterized protein YkwD
MHPTRTRLICLGLAATAMALAVGLPLSARARSANDGTVLAMVSAARSGARVGAVYSAPALDTIARRQSERMRSAGRIFHNPRLTDDLNAARLGWMVAGENVGVGPSVADVERAFMASPSHRANILKREYDAIGVYAATTADGRVYVTQVFARLVRKPCDRFVIAEDGSRVPPSFYGATC